MRFPLHLSCLTIFAVGAATVTVTSAWSFQPTRTVPASYQETDADSASMLSGRRRFLSQIPVLAAATIISPALVVGGWQPPANAAAAAAEVFTGKLTVDQAKQRFQLARADLQYLQDHYTEIINTGGGDGVRNYLGTQGVSSNLFGIQKVLKMLQQEADDIVEYTETMDEFNAYYYQAEGAAYQSMFAEHSSAKATPEQLLATARKDITELVKYMDQLAVQLNL